MTQNYGKIEREKKKRNGKLKVLKIDMINQCDKLREIIIAGFDCTFVYTLSYTGFEQVTWHCVPCQTKLNHVPCQNVFCQISV